jgi:MFS family permease
LGALLAAAIARRLGERRSFVIALAVTAFAVLSSAGSGNVEVLLGLRFWAGVTGAVCFMVGGALVAHAGRLLSRTESKILLGVYFAGGGVGIVVSGFVVPLVLSVGNWHTAWLALGLLSVLCLACASLATKAHPETSAPGGMDTSGRIDLPRLWVLLISYGLFSAGYIAYMTFIVAALRLAGGDGRLVIIFWTLLGLSATAAAFLWGPLLSRLPAGVAVAVVLVLVSAGAILPVFAFSLLAWLASRSVDRGDRRVYDRFRSWSIRRPAAGRLAVRRSGGRAHGPDDRCRASDPVSCICVSTRHRRPETAPPRPGRIS